MRESVRIDCRWSWVRDMVDRGLQCTARTCRIGPHNQERPEPKGSPSPTGEEAVPIGGGGPPPWVRGRRPACPPALVPWRAVPALWVTGEGIPAGSLPLPSVVEEATAVPGEGRESVARVSPEGPRVGDRLPVVAPLPPRPSSTRSPPFGRMSLVTRWFPSRRGYT